MKKFNFNQSALDLVSYIEAKAYGVVYYCGIDDFLESYRNAVYNCLN